MQITANLPNTCTSIALLVVPQFTVLDEQLNTPSAVTWTLFTGELMIIPRGDIITGIEASLSPLGAGAHTNWRFSPTKTQMSGFLGDCIFNRPHPSSLRPEMDPLKLMRAPTAKYALMVTNTDKKVVIVSTYYLWCCRGIANLIHCSTDIGSWCCHNYVITGLSAKNIAISSPWEHDWSCSWRYLACYC